MDPLLAIIIVVFGILQLILFFKVWGMTNDTEKIKDKILNVSDIQKAELAYICGNKEAVEYYLHKSLISDLKLYAGNSFAYGKYEDAFERAKQRYTSYYNDYKADLPDFSKYEDKANLPSKVD